MTVVFIQYSWNILVGVQQHAIRTSSHCKTQYVTNMLNCCLVEQAHLTLYINKCWPLGPSNANSLHCSSTAINGRDTNSTSTIYQDRWSSRNIYLENLGEIPRKLEGGVLLFYLSRPKILGGRPKILGGCLDLKLSKELLFTKSIVMKW